MPQGMACALLLSGILVFAGCAAPVRKCEGKKTAGEAIMALNAQRGKIAPIKAAGQCLLKYHFEGKLHRENFPVKLWVNPPNEIYLQGDVAFDATGLVVGANAGEFWFWLKPKEISSYWWGRWSQAGVRENFPMNPATMLEALGAVNLEQGDWSLTHGRYDVLWLHGEDGTLLKRVFIEPCDYLAAKIEYFNPAGVLVAGAELEKYKRIAEGFFVPMRIKLFTLTKDGSEESAQVSLGSVEQVQISGQQRERLFVRPRPRGFERVYQIIDGEAVEQTGK
jgi:hypothetical protein